ncbi:hypothetical protein HYH03_006306 [Edaphochlamys debaryana]|uniref:General transcription and DNA repair factor IIH subunit TFB4 n=1 Tax=Edaphochlamys debaryana TaxID=47281 RepID=A0A835Y498_9CHLO|nr:hypothetical protein HYH03_006306 [Edaphochlamys debaryana]|eukprot:KAG2495706.1 hypothetical protein HYH03_006306 [Edaphochlamys debaryana]
MAEEGDLLVVLLDLALLSEEGVGAGGQAVAPADVLAQLLAFANAYTMLSSHNRLAVYAGSHDMCQLVHLGLGEGSSGSVFPAASLHAKLGELVRKAEGGHEPGANGTAPHPAGGGRVQPFALSGALSRALCLIHRLQQQAAARGRVRCCPRLLVLQGSRDGSAQYIPVMNSIFSAQRAQVVIDAVVLAPEDSSFLQQAANLTGGLYFRPPRGPGGLLGLLLAHFVTDTATRAQMDAEQSLGVDFRASCFCHKYVIETGFVCSVCLSIFCQPCRACTTCGTAFGAGGGPHRGGAGAAGHGAAHATEDGAG